MKGHDEETYECADCGTDINEGEFKTFGVCDACFDKGVTQRLWEAKKSNAKTIGELSNEDLPTAFISREEHERILKEYKDFLDVIMRIVYSKLEDQDKIDDIKRKFPKR